MDDARIPTTDQLVAEMAWVRRLARALVKNTALADDVAQDTWVVAAERRPDTDRPLRPWLARVVFNLIRTRRTSEARREQRELAVEDDRGVPTPAELVERVELQRTVADEVLALAEPYRSTVLLHFFEGYSSAEIARKLGIPDGTVRRRLKVALDQLRDAFRKRSDPPKGGWLAALIPVARLPGATPASAAMGVVAVKKVIGIVVLLVLLLAIGIGVIWPRQARRGEPTEGSSTNRAQRSIDEHDTSGRLTPIPEWIPQAGAPPRRIAGRVVLRGSPIGGARVTLGFEVMGEPGPVIISADPVPVGAVQQRVAEVTSAPDGTFDFGAQPAARFTVSASAENYSAGAVFVDNANPRTSSDQLVVQLANCGTRLSGVIADASGGGIAKATISVDGLNGTESSANGSYRLCVSARDALAPPSVRVRVEADGYGTTNETVLAAGDIRHDFLLVPEAVLIGRVVTRSGEPVAHARVTAMAEPAEIPHHVASGWTDSDKDGRFRIARLAPGAFQLAAQAKGLRMMPVAVFARPATTSREIQLVLDRKPSARVQGHVFRANAPASGVTIQAVQAGPVAGTISQADGSFVFDEMPYGKTRFFASPNQAEAANAIEIASPVVDDVRIEITKAASVHGHVMRQGKPVPGASVVYVPPPQATFFGGQPATTTDAAGAFVLDLPAGPGQLVAWDTSQKAFANPQPVNATSNEDQTVDIELGFAGEVIGSVVNEAGAAVPGAQVRLDLTDGSGDMCESITDTKGRFDCSMLVGGEYRATVTPSPGARQGFAPAVGDHFETIHVPPAGAVTGIQLAVKDERLAVRGTVVDDTGTPLADVHVEAIARGESTMDFPSTLSDASGHFEIGNLARGTYTLGAHAADGSEGEVPDVVAGATAVSVKLDRAGAIEGTLTGFSTTPDVFVTSSSIANGRMRGGRALVDGASFSRIGLPPGRYNVEAMAGADTDGQSIEVQPGKTAHVDLHGRGVGTVEGTVSELATHAPVAGMRCDAHVVMDGQMSPIQPDPSQQAFTDGAGHFVVNAPIGRVRIFCFPLNGGPLSTAGTDVDVTSGARANVKAFSVRATFGSSPGAAGFAIAPDVLPLTVAQVPAGPVATAGLRPGDQVLTIDGAPLQGVLPDGAMTLLANHRPGTAITLGVSRGGSVQTIKIVAGR